jgi:hypothetical protein
VKLNFSYGKIEQIERYCMNEEIEQVLRLCLREMYDAHVRCPIDNMPPDIGTAIQQTQYVLGKYTGHEEPMNNKEFKKFMHIND